MGEVSELITKLMTGYDKAKDTFLIMKELSRAFETKTEVDMSKINKVGQPESVVDLIMEVQRYVVGQAEEGRDEREVSRVNGREDGSDETKSPSQVVEAGQGATDPEDIKFQRAGEDFAKRAANNEPADELDEAMFKVFEASRTEDFTEVIEAGKQKAFGTGLSFYIGLGSAGAPMKWAVSIQGNNGFKYNEILGEMDKDKARWFAIYMMIDLIREHNWGDCDVYINGSEVVKSIGKISRKKDESIQKCSVAVADALKELKNVVFRHDDILVKPANAVAELWLEKELKEKVNNAVRTIKTRVAGN